MPEIKIKLDNDTYEKIKELAKKDERPVTQFTSRLLRNIAGTLSLSVVSPYPNQTNPYIAPTPTLITAPDTVLQPPFIPTANTTSQPPFQLTIEQLREAGIKNFKLEKQLLPEEQQLQDLKLQQKTNNLLQQRERIWFRRAKEVMNDYWDDAQCQYFAHSHIYGDAIYHSRPSDPNATIPEADDSNLELLLQDAISQYEQQDEEQYLYQTEIEEKENKLKEPNNEYYQQVKKYCINNDFTQDLYNILQYPSGDNLQYNHDTMIYNAMRIPNDERVWDAQRWQDFSEYFK